MLLFRRNFIEEDNELIKKTECTPLDYVNISDIVFEICKGKIETARVLFYIYQLGNLVDNEFELMNYVNETQKEYDNDIDLLDYFTRLYELDNVKDWRQEVYAYCGLRRIYEERFQERIKSHDYKEINPFKHNHHLNTNYL